MIAWPVLIPFVLGAFGLGLIWGTWVKRALMCSACRAEHDTYLEDPKCRK